MEFRWAYSSWVIWCSWLCWKQIFVLTPSAQDKIRELFIVFKYLFVCLLLLFDLSFVCCRQIIAEEVIYIVKQHQFSSIIISFSIRQFKFLSEILQFVMIQKSNLKVHHEIAHLDESIIFQKHTYDNYFIIVSHRKRAEISLRKRYTHPISCGIRKLVISFLSRHRK